jgi:hypothetical protein
MYSSSSGILSSCSYIEALPAVLNNYDRPLLL